MKPSWICDEEGLICSKCGKDVYHCTCEKDVGELMLIGMAEVFKAIGRELYSSPTEELEYHPCNENE